MIVDYEYTKGQLVVSYLNDMGRVEMEHIDWPFPQDYETTYDTDPNAIPDLKTWENKRVKYKSVDRPNKHSVAYFLYNLEKEQKEKLLQYKVPEVYFIDIETEVIDEFPDPKEAKTRVLSIAIVRETMVLYIAIKKLTPDEEEWVKESTNKYFESQSANFTYLFKYFEDDEERMLKYFFEKLAPAMPCITGWNFISYDWQYLVNRASKYSGINVKSCSPTGKLMREKMLDAWIMPSHKLVVDYLDLFKKWDQNIKIRESFKLDYVADQILKVKKVHYEGKLNELYENDYKNFAHYNIVDTILVYYLEKVGKFFDIMCAIAYLSKIRLQDTLGTVSVTEGILREDFLTEKNIVMISKPSTDSASLEGGYVLEPIPGMKSHVAIFDFASLYPTTIRQYKIAPEGFLGKISDDGKYAEWGAIRTPLDDLSKFVICDNGAVFKNEISITVNKFAQIYSERKKHKKLAQTASAKVAQLKNELKKIQKGG